MRPIDLKVVHPIEIFGAIPDDMLRLRPGEHLTLARELPWDPFSLLRQLEDGALKPYGVSAEDLRAWLVHLAAAPSRLIPLLDRGSPPHDLLRSDGR